MEGDLKDIAERELDSSLVTLVRTVGHNGGILGRVAGVGAPGDAVQSPVRSRTVRLFRRPGGVRNRHSLISAIRSLPSV